MEVVRQILTDMPLARQRVRIEGDEEAVARFDPVFLTLVLRNLLENAISHSQGPVVVRGSEADAEVEMLVEDEGSGIPVDELPRVTERFFRGRERSPTGSGLGLAIAQEAVAQMGGTLALRNRDPHGLIAVLSIPAQGA